MRGLVLNVDVGAGHRRAAEGLRDGIAALRPGTELTFVEALDYLGAEVSRTARDLYFGVQREAPGVWGFIYEQRELFKLLRPLSEWVDGLRASGLVPRVAELRPQVIVATHPIACGLGAALRRERHVDCPLVALMTDFDGHPAWIVRGVDLYLAATTRVASDLAGHGLPSGIVVASGIPLRNGFAEAVDASAARTRLGLDARRLTILMLGGGLGLGPVLDTARALGSLEGPIQLLVVAGKNRELEDGARALARSSRAPIHVAGQVENMWDYIAAADIAVGKPGGLTCAELLAVGVPLVALQPLAGQEEANCAALVRERAAVRAGSVSEAREALVALLRDPRQLQTMRQAALRLGRPAAARAAARAVIDLVGR